MITESVVRELAKKLQTSEGNILREYVQHLFLSALYQKPNSNHLYFKGGTALRILYGSPRFSEDLHFSAGFKSSKSLESLLLATLTEIEREGIHAGVLEAKTTSGGYLAIVECSVNAQSVHVQLHVSLRESVCKGEMDAIVSDFVPTFTLMHLPQSRLVEEKLQALFSRKKPRDFYDLYFMLRANLLKRDQRRALKKIPALLKDTDISFSKELKVFLPASHWPIIRDFKNTLLRETERYLQ